MWIERQELRRGLLKVASSRVLPEDHARSNAPCSKRLNCWNVIAIAGKEDGHIASASLLAAVARVEERLARSQMVA